MAQIAESGGGGKKSLSPDLNLVPFIDLLSVCICFLLIAAVWLQIGSVPVKQAYGTAATDAPADLLALEVRLVGATAVKIDVMKGKRTVLTVDAQGATRAELSKALTQQLAAAIVTLKGGKTVSTSALIDSAMVHPAKVADYGTLVAVMDVLRKQDIVNLAVVPGAG